MQFNLPVVYDNLTWQERRIARKQYVHEQGGLCYYCQAPLTEAPAEVAARKKVKTKYYPDGFFKSPIHLHHNHITGLTLGAVHCHCNAVLWEHEGE